MYSNQPFLWTFTHTHTHKYEKWTYLETHMHVHGCAWAAVSFQNRSETWMCVFIYNDLEVELSLSEWSSVVDHSVCQASADRAPLWCSSFSRKWPILPVISIPPSISCPQWELMWLQHCSSPTDHQSVHICSTLLISGGGNEHTAA